MKNMTPTSFQSFYADCEAAQKLFWDESTKTLKLASHVHEFPLDKGGRAALSAQYEIELKAQTNFLRCRRMLLVSIAVF